MRLTGVDITSAALHVTVVTDLRRLLPARSSQSRMLRPSTLLTAACSPYRAITPSTVLPCSARSLAAAMSSGGSRCAAAARRRRRAARPWQKSRTAAAVRVHSPAPHQSERFETAKRDLPPSLCTATGLCYACPAHAGTPVDRTIPMASRTDSECCVCTSTKGPTPACGSSKRGRRDRRAQRQRHHAATLPVGLRQVTAGHIQLRTLSGGVDRGGHRLAPLP